MFCKIICNALQIRTAKKHLQQIFSLPHLNAKRIAANLFKKKMKKWLKTFLSGAATFVQKKSSWTDNCSWKRRVYDTGLSNGKNNYLQLIWIRGDECKISLTNYFVLEGLQLNDEFSTNGCASSAMSSCL